MDIVTLAASRKYTDKKIMESAAVGIKYEIVDSLPSSGEAQTIYFVKSNNSLINNYYDEYVWISSSSAFEKIGSTQIDDFIQNPSAAEVGQTIVVKEVNKEGKPIAWEMADLPEQVQPDWNQNDPNQPDYVKNRIAYDSRSDEYDGETITITIPQGELLTDDNSTKYLGPIDDQVVSYTAVLTGKNKWNETYTVEYKSIWMACEAYPYATIYSSLAVDTRFHEATSHALVFSKVPVDTELGPAGLYMITGQLPWDTQYGDMTLTVHPRFAKTGELKPIDQKYLGTPAPFNWKYKLSDADAEDFRGKIGASDFSGEYPDLLYKPLNGFDPDVTQTVTIDNSDVTVTYTSDNLRLINELPVGLLVTFVMPDRVNSTSTMRVSIKIVTGGGSARLFGPYYVWRRYAGVDETIAASYASINGYSKDSVVALVWNGQAFYDIGAAYVYGGDAFYKPVGVSKGGVPSGGARGTVLKKLSNSDYDYYWTSIYPDAPKKGQVLVANTTVTGQPAVFQLSWQDPTLAASDVVVIKATLASYQDSTFLIDYSPVMIRNLIQTGKFVVLVQNDNNDTNTYTYQYIFGNMYSNPSTAQGGGYGWSMPYMTQINGEMSTVVNRIEYVGMENDKYKWEIKKFKIPLEAVTT